MHICRKLQCCPCVWGSHWEPCHRVAYGNQPARTHLYDRSLLLCDCCQLNQSCMITAKWEVRKRYFWEHSWFAWFCLKQPEKLGWSTGKVQHCSRYTDWRPNLLHQIKWVSSLVAVPSDLPLPPAVDWSWSLFGTEFDTHTCMIDARIYGWLSAKLKFRHEWQR